MITLAKSKPKKPEKQVVSCDDLEVAHNYSSQKLNSTEMAKEKLRDKLASVSLLTTAKLSKHLFLHFTFIDISRPFSSFLIVFEAIIVGMYIPVIVLKLSSIMIP